MKLGDTVLLEGKYQSTIVCIFVLSSGKIDYMIGWKHEDPCNKCGFLLVKMTFDTYCHNKRYAFVSNHHEFDKCLWAYDEQLSVVDPPTSNGYNCISCNQPYPYAQANLPNNQLKCYSCRNQ